jgi:hypothetical protein
MVLSLNKRGMAAAEPSRRDRSFNILGANLIRSKHNVTTSRTVRYHHETVPTLCTVALPQAGMGKYGKAKKGSRHGAVSLSIRQQQAKGGRKPGMGGIAKRQRKREKKVRERQLRTTRETSHDFVDPYGANTSAGAKGARSRLVGSRFGSRDDGGARVPFIATRAPPSYLSWLLVSASC